MTLANGLSINYNGARRVTLQLSPGSNYKTNGLCGSPNKNQQDDFMTPQGKGVWELGFSCIASLFYGNSNVLEMVES